MSGLNFQSKRFQVTNETIRRRQSNRQRVKQTNVRREGLVKMTPFRVLDMELVREEMLARRRVMETA